MAEAVAVGAGEGVRVDVERAAIGGGWTRRAGCRLDRTDARSGGSHRRGRDGGCTEDERQDDHGQIGIRPQPSLHQFTAVAALVATAAPVWEPTAACYKGRSVPSRIERQRPPTSGCERRPRRPVEVACARDAEHGRPPARAAVEVTDRSRPKTVNDQRPLPRGAAARAVMRCVVDTVRLLAHRSSHLPKEHVGLRLRFADGTSARVFRETVVDRPPPDQPCLLVVAFRLRVLPRPLACALPVGVHLEHAAVRGVPGVRLQAVARS